MNESLPSGRFGAVLCDPPWHFETWSPNGYDRHPSKHYDTMAAVDIRQLPVADLAASDCVLFKFLMTPANHQRKTRDWNGFARDYYAIPYQNRYILGHHRWYSTESL